MSPVRRYSTWWLNLRSVAVAVPESTLWVCPPLRCREWRSNLRSVNVAVPDWVRRRRWRDDGTEPVASIIRKKVFLGWTTPLRPGKHLCHFRFQVVNHLNHYFILWLFKDGVRVALFFSLSFFVCLCKFLNLSKYEYIYTYLNILNIPVKCAVPKNIILGVLDLKTLIATVI